MFRQHNEPVPLTRRELFAGSAALGASTAAFSATAPGERVLADWKKWPLAGCRISLGAAEPGKDGWLVSRANKGSGRAGIALQPESGAWNLESFAEIAVPVRNLENRNVRVFLRVDDDETAGLPPDKRRGIDFEALISPGPEPVWLVVLLADTKPSPLAGKMVSMVAPPPEFVRRGRVNGARLVALQVFVPNPDSEQSIAVGPVAARGVPARLRQMPPERAFPFIDEFGQVIHRDWKDKIHNEGELRKRLETEGPDLATSPRPAAWDRFGGWAAGPRLDATGFCRAEKRGGVWWMVDPEGRLFWSHGVVRVGTRIRVGTEYHGTPLLDREHYFRLPARNSPLGAFYATQPQSTRGYYLGKDNHAIYDFLEANLFRKYGREWRAACADKAQRRLASWGLNTIANSSDPAIYLKRRTPYTAIVYSAPLGRSEFRIEGSAGNWGRLPDPFDPGWRRLIDRTLQTDLKESLGDPWCLGFFVDNELHRGDTCYLAEATLASPRTQASKQALVAGLRNKYGGIAELNRAWSKQFRDWDGVLVSTALPDRKRDAVRADLEAFSERVTDAYFRGCRDAIKAASPHHMYLGVRFAGGGNPAVMRTAARYCDVVSINRYALSVADLALPEGVDRPIVIGEFHFGALDAVPFGIALVKVATPADRARAYRVYVESALRHPAVVGTHWFQYYDQPTSGRFDGENYHTGLIDICDTPYAETVGACRRMGAAMYGLRMKG
jgi:hypothetical protein